MDEYKIDVLLSGQDLEKYNNLKMLLGSERNDQEIIRTCIRLAEKTLLG